MNTPLVDTTKKTSAVPYVIAIVGMVLLAVVAVLGILMLRPNVDNTPMITLVLGFISTITTGIFVFLKTQETHLTVNSQMEKYKNDILELQSLRASVVAVKEEQQRVETLRTTRVHEAALLSAQHPVSEVTASVPKPIVDVPPPSTSAAAGTVVRVGDTVKIAPSKPVV